MRFCTPRAPGLVPDYTTRRKRHTWCSSCNTLGTMCSRAANRCVAGRSLLQRRDRYQTLTSLQIAIDRARPQHRQRALQASLTTLSPRRLSHGHVLLFVRELLAPSNACTCVVTAAEPRSGVPPWIVPGRTSGCQQRAAARRPAGGVVGGHSGAGRAPGRAGCEARPAGAGARAPGRLRRRVLRACTRM